MKLLCFWPLYPLLLSSFLLGKDASNRAQLSPSLDLIKDEDRANASLGESQQLKPPLDLPWISMYVPVRSCHRELREKYGEFSPPEYPNGFEGSIWCNWTVWAGARKHIVIYIKGFKSDEGCDKNEDKIFFNGVSSLAENTVIYACWKKELHVFATYARGVHVVFLMRHSTSPKREEFMGKYYIFKHRETKPLDKDFMGSEMPIPEPSQSTIKSILPSQKGPFIFMLENDHSSLAPSHRIDKATDLSKSLQAKGRMSVTTLADVVGQVTSTVSLTPESLHLLHILANSEESPCSQKTPEQFMEEQNPYAWGMSTEEMSVELGESTILSDVLSEVPYLDLSPIEPSSHVGGMGLPSRMQSTDLVPLFMGDLQMGSRATQPDYHALDTVRKCVSHDTVASTEASTWDFKEGIPISCQTSNLAREVVSRDAVDLEALSLLTPEQNLIGTKMHSDYELLPSETPGRGRLQGYPESSMLLLSDAKLVSVGETGTAPISEYLTNMLDVDPVLESSGEIADELKVTLAATVLCSVLEDDLHLRPRSEQSSADIFLNLLSDMLSSSSLTELESSHLLDAAMKHEISLSPSETTLALLATAGLELSPSLLLGTMETLPLPTMELEPLLSYSPTVPFWLAVPDLEPTTLELKHALSSPMALTSPFVSVGLDAILSTPAMLLEPTLSEQELIVSSITAEALSLSTKELEPSISEMECAWSKIATIVETALELETGTVVLDPVSSPTTTIKSLVASETISAFSQVNEIVPPFGLRMVGADSAVVPWRSSCCRHAMGASEQEDASLAAVWSSSLPVPVTGAPYSCHHAAFVSTTLERLSPSAEVSTSVKQPLLERRDDDDDSAARLGDRDVHFTRLNLASKSESFPSLDRFTVSALSLLNGPITEMPVTFVGEEKQPESSTECGFVSSTMSTPSLPHTEMQTREMQLEPLKVVKERRQMPQPIPSWGRPHNAKWNLAGNSSEFTVASLNVVGTLVKTQTQKELLDLQTLLIPSDFENKVASKVGHLGNHLELGFPWLLVYLPLKSCHVVLKDEAGTFSPPVLSSMQSNMWCNWTIWAGPRKHILIYIEGFEGNPICEENQDKIIFQGVLSSVESKVVYACRNYGTLIFATQAVAVHVVFLSKVSSQNHGLKHFKGRYYIFDDYELSSLTSGGDITEEPVFKSNSSVIFSPKWYATHSRHVLDFVKTSRKLSHETRLPITSRQTWDKSGHAVSLKAFLGMPLDNSTQVSPLKSTENVTLKVLDVKMLPFAKLSFDGGRTETKTSPSNLKKTLILGSESLENEEKVMPFKPTVSSASPHLSQKFRTMAKLVSLKDTGIVTESAKFEVGHITTHQRSAHMKDTGRAIFGKYILQNGITFPQVLLKEQEIQIPLPQSAPVEKQEQILRALKYNDGFSRKTTEAMNFQPLELKEALEGEQMDNQEYRQESGINDQYMAVAAVKGGNKSHKPEFITTEMPENLSVKRKSHLTTLGCPNVLSAPPLRTLNSDLIGTTSISGNLKSTRVETTIASYPASVGNTDHTQRKATKPNHPNSLPDWVSSNKASSGAEYKNNSYGNISVSRSHENYTILKSQHNPGDVLFEITFGIEHKGQIPHNGSEQEKALIESIKLQVQEKVKLFSNKVKEIGLKEIIRKEENEMRRGNGPNLIFTFWLHLKPEDRNISHFIHSQLNDLSGESMGAGEIQLVSVGDVNECSFGIELCGDEAICLNGYGTYLCQCKEDYEDHSLTKLGTLCIHSPRSGIGSWYSYAEILVGTTVFFIFVLVAVISVLCSVVKKRCKKEEEGFPGAASSGTRAHLQPTAFQQNNIQNLLTLDPAKLKLRARSPDLPSQLRTSPSKTYRVSIEQSDCL